jgi:hypothetical protein
VEDASPEQVEAGAPVRRPLDRLEAVDLTLGLALAPGQRQGAEHRVPILARRRDERGEFGQAGIQRLGLRPGEARGGGGLVGPVPDQAREAIQERGGAPALRVLRQAPLDGLCLLSIPTGYAGGDSADRRCSSPRMR